MRNIFLAIVLLAWGTMDAVNKSETPAYLYKILSYRNWQATERRKVVILSGDDDQFIHFSTAKQIDRIAQKYWADAPQYVVLKIDAAKLQGMLKYEANPGGLNKYYHLYKGFIPIDAISEAKVIFREPLVSFHQNQLDIVQVGDPVLRKKARFLTKEEILSPKIQGLIEEMKAAMRAAPGVGLAAPQIGHSLQIAVIEDMEHSHLTPQQLAERDRHKVPLQVIINPILTLDASETASFFEGCLSVPTFLGVVPRAKSVRVECLNERGEPVVIHARGWHARILQHEIDHLNGMLFIDKAVKQTLMTEENYVKLWNGKPIRDICNCLIPEAKK
jgi:peptide deformylase